MPSRDATLLCHYRYDPLDCLIGLKSSEQEELQRFYCKSRLATEIQGLVRCSIMQEGDQLLAQQHRLGDTLEVALLATDQQRSVMHTVGECPLPIVYSPYGHRRTESDLTSLLGFNGERPDVITRHYFLGNGYRAFNPNLMRFNSPDSLSPFDKGGLNPYVYCFGDPVNMSDPTGNVAWFNLTTFQIRELSVAARTAGKSANGFFPGVNFSKRGVKPLSFGKRTKFEDFRNHKPSKSIELEEVKKEPKRLSVLSGEVIREYAHELDMAPGLRKFMKELVPSSTEILERFSKSRRILGIIAPDLPDEFGPFKVQYPQRRKVHGQIRLLSNYAKSVRTSYSPSEIMGLQHAFSKYTNTGSRISMPTSTLNDYTDYITDYYTFT